MPPPPRSSYLGAAYGRRIAGFVTPNPSIEQSPRDVIAFTRTRENLHVPAVFLEPQLEGSSSVLTETAAQRGAETVLAGPARGPIVDEAPTSTVVVPALPTTMGPSPARTIAVLSAVIDALDPRAAAEALAERFRMLADELDAELTAVSPERAEDVNAARQLRAFARDAHVVHSGTTRHGLALAELVAALWSCRGLASGFVDADGLPQALELARGGAPAPADDIFHDPFLDGPVELVPLKVVLWAQPDAHAPVAPNTRAETVASQHLGESVTVLRLLARAYAVTALDDPSDG
ncbi:zinc ABC transporter substrate-binding protein [Corynebacterium sp. NML 120412]|uniref:zinc ABC transporter substrate-binding protein n=1 Tax=Corynebacterium sp. NML 120412 TaxID=2029401 RepID=UPI0018EA10D8